MKENKKIKTTIKIDKNIKEKLDKFRRYGYNKNEIVTMGIILLEDSKNFEILLKNKILEEKTTQKMIELKQSIDELNKRIDKIKYKNQYYKLQEIIKQITEEEIIPREEIIHYCNVKPEKLGKEYFLNKSEETGIPADIIINELINKYTQTYLEDLNMFID